MVDGILASCYASSHHDLYHIGMTPVQFFPEIIQWIFGEDDGISSYVRTTEKIGKMVLPNEQAHILAI